MHFIDEKLNTYIDYVDNYGNTIATPIVHIKIFHEIVFVKKHCRVLH